MDKTEEGEMRKEDEEHSEYYGYGHYLNCGIHSVPLSAETWFSIH